jgi:hypothetical protein
MWAVEKWRNQLILSIFSKFIWSAYTLIAATFFGLGFGVASILLRRSSSATNTDNNLNESHQIFRHGNKIFARVELLRRVLMDIQNGQYQSHCLTSDMCSTDFLAYFSSIDHV